MSSDFDPEARAGFRTEQILWNFVREGDADDGAVSYNHTIQMHDARSPYEQLEDMLRSHIADALRDAHAAGQRAMRERVASHVERVFLHHRFRQDGGDRAADILHDVLIRTIATSVREMPERGK